MSKISGPGRGSTDQVTTEPQVKAASVRRLGEREQELRYGIIDADAWLRALLPLASADARVVENRILGRFRDSARRQRWLSPELYRCYLMVRRRWLLENTFPELAKGLPDELRALLLDRLKRVLTVEIGKRTAERELRELWASIRKDAVRRRLRSEIDVRQLPSGPEPTKRANPKRHRNSISEKIYTDIQTVAKPGMTTMKICENLGNSARPPRATWRHLPWLEAFRDDRYRSAVTKYISKARHAKQSG